MCPKCATSECVCLPSSVVSQSRAANHSVPSFLSTTHVAGRRRARARTRIPSQRAAAAIGWLQHCLAQKPACARPSVHLSPRLRVRLRLPCATPISQITHPSAHPAHTHARSSPRLPCVPTPAPPSIGHARTILGAQACTPSWLFLPSQFSSLPGSRAGRHGRTGSV